MAVFRFSFRQSVKTISKKTVIFQFVRLNLLVYATTVEVLRVSSFESFSFLKTTQNNGERKFYVCVIDVSLLEISVNNDFSLD